MTAAKRSRRQKTRGRAASVKALERQVKELLAELERAKREATAARKKAAPKKAKKAAPKKAKKAVPKKVKKAAPKKAAPKKPTKAAKPTKPTKPATKPTKPATKPSTKLSTKPATKPKKKQPAPPAAPPKRPEKTPGSKERKLRLTREMTVEALQEAFEESRQQGQIPPCEVHPPKAWMYRRGTISLYLTVPVGKLVTREVIEDVYMRAQLAADEIRDTMLTLIRQDGRLADPEKLRFATTLEAFSFGDGNSNGKSARTVIDTTKAGKRINEIATVFYMGHRSVRYAQYAKELRQLLERILEPPTVLLCLWVYGWEKIGKKRNRRGP